VDKEYEEEENEYNRTEIAEHRLVEDKKKKVFFNNYND